MNCTRCTLEGVAEFSLVMTAERTDETGGTGYTETMTGYHVLMCEHCAVQLSRRVTDLMMEFWPSPGKANV